MIGAVIYMMYSPRLIVNFTQVIDLKRSHRLSRIMASRLWTKFQNQQDLPFPICAHPQQPCELTAFVNFSNTVITVRDSSKRS